MAEPLSVEAIFERLRAMGFFEVEMSRDDISRGWCIRADAGHLRQRHSQTLSKESARPSQGAWAYRQA